MSAPNSFMFYGCEGRKYRVAFNPQRDAWFAAYLVGKKRHRVSLGVRTKVLAEMAVKELDVPAKKPEPERPPEPEKLSWTEFQRMYLEFKTQQGKAPRSVSRYKAALDACSRYFKTVGVANVDEITLIVLEGYMQYRTKVEERNIKTAHNDVLTIKNAMKWGSKASRGLLKINPALDWETQKPNRPKRKTYKAHEVEALEKGVRDWLRPVVTMLAWTGLRIGELENLRWSDVDLEKRVLHVRVQEDWKPKGRADRTVPLHPRVEAVLKRQPIGMYAITSPGGGKLREQYTLKCLKEDQERLKLQKGDLHGFRRFFATTMMVNGVSPHTVMQWGGWKSMETMMRYLADVDVSESVIAMEKAVQKLATA
ncbi:MAG: site-specific integrase [Planctomycetota bacterium]